MGKGRHVSVVIIDEATKINEADWNKIKNINASVGYR